MSEATAIMYSGGTSSRWLVEKYLRRELPVRDVVAVFFAEVDAKNRAEHGWTYDDVNEVEGRCKEERVRFVRCHPKVGMIEHIMKGGHEIPCHHMDCKFRAEPKTAPSVSTPVLDWCKWSWQPGRGSTTLVRCSDRVAHAKSPYCEKHIAEEMHRRDTKKPEGRKESPFQQSHSLLAGGIWSLRSEDGR